MFKNNLLFGFWDISQRPGIEFVLIIAINGNGLEFYVDDETKDVLCLNFSIIFDLFSFHPEIYSPFIHLECLDFCS